MLDGWPDCGVRRQMTARLDLQASHLHPGLGKGVLKAFNRRLHVRRSNPKLRADLSGSTLAELRRSTDDHRAVISGRNIVLPEAVP
jgi:hypothetical protein